MRLAELVSPALADHLFPASAAAAGPGWPDTIRRSLLANRLHRITALRWAQIAREAGIDVLALKGLASAHLVYDDPDLRALSDADLLVRTGDAERLKAVLAEHGLEQSAPMPRGRWGHVSDASGRPMGRIADASNVDIHIHPDAWPMHLGLSTEAVFAAGNTVATSEGPLSVPCPTDLLLLAISHAARDLFQANTMKAMVDSILIVERLGGRLDWDRFRTVARRGRIWRPARAFLAIACELAELEADVPDDCRRVPGGSEFERVRKNYIDVFPVPESAWARLRRELALTATPDVALVRNLKRIRGLVRPLQGPLSD
jgi:hypothetical protein